MDAFVGCGWTNMDHCADTCVWMDIFVPRNSLISDERQVWWLWVEVARSWFQSGSSIAAWSLGRHSWDSSGSWTGRGQKGDREAIMREEGNQAGGLRLLWACASIHRSRLWMDPRAYSWLTNLLLPDAVLIDPPTWLGDSIQYFQLLFHSICCLDRDWEKKTWEAPTALNKLPWYIHFLHWTFPFQIKVEHVL